MKSCELPKIGMRKIKSIIALVLSFLIWQIVRIFFPLLEVHPTFGYLYSIIEMRDSAEKTKRFGLLRIKATFIGLAIGLLLLSVSVLAGNIITNELLITFIDLFLICFGTLLSLWFAQLLDCKTFCGIAAIITVICMIRDRNTDINIYLYAILRVVQTLLGVFSAWLVNSFICRYPKNTEEQ